MADDSEPGGFGEGFRERLHALFTAADAPGPLAARSPDANTVAELVQVAEGGLAPDRRVPWRIFAVTDPDMLARVIWNFEVCNADALAHRHPRRERALAEYHTLRAAPVHRAVFAEAPAAPSRLTDVAPQAGVRETAAAAVTQLRLAAHAAGLRATWITTLDAEALRHALGVPAACPFVGHICMGHPAPSHIPSNREQGGHDGN